MTTMSSFSLSDADMGSIADKMAERGYIEQCPACRPGKMTVGRDVVDVDLRHTKNVIPCVAMICVNCGYMRMHSLAILGLKRLE